MTSDGDAPVLVTGGTGFLGRGLVRALAERGVETHVLARSTSDREPLSDLELTWHEGDLVDAASVERAVAAVSRRARHAGTGARVIHSGAVISYRTKDTELQRRVNVEGTRNVLSAARKHGVSRFVHVSSVVAIGHAPVPGESVDERAPFNAGGLGVDYVDTKRAAEELVMGAAKELDVVVVNPGAIFGPVSEGANTARFIHKVVSGRGPLLAPPGGIGVVGLADTVDGTLLALERGRPGERYLLVESYYSSCELFRLVARIGESRGVWGTVPQGLWSLVVLGARVVDRVHPLRLAPPQALVLLGKRMHFDAEKARSELGWRPRPFEDVLRETVEHVQAAAHASRSGS
jgi:dihydroflavonol-4-reductase